MDITIQYTFLPHTDADASLAFYRDTLGFEVRNDVGYEQMRPTPDPGTTDDERRTVAEMMAKGTYASIVLSTTDVDGVFEKVAASGAEVAQEPIDQPYGVRDCAFRDPAGNMVRIQQPD
jgi:uncharacterized glyoxalase superfamily protein PhnB